MALQLSFIKAVTSLGGASAPQIKSVFLTPEWHVVDKTGLPLFSEVCVLSVDEEAEGGQRRSQLGGFTGGCGQEGVVLQLLEGLQRGNILLILTQNRHELLQQML